MEMRRRKRSMSRSWVLRGKLRNSFFKDDRVSDPTMLSSPGYDVWGLNEKRPLRAGRSFYP
jgi:hypothetical protein